jgi:serine/threonine-protein kinase RsbW
VPRSHRAPGVIGTGRSVASNILKVTAEVHCLGQIARFVEEQCLGLAARPEPIADLLQAVDEAATNVIMHGYRQAPGHIEIEITRRDAGLLVWMRDQAPFFDVAGVPPPDLTLPLEQRRDGGLGVFLMRQLTDGLVSRPLPGGGNELTLYKVAPPTH